MAEQRDRNLIGTTIAGFVCVCICLIILQYGMETRIGKSASNLMEVELDLRSLEKEHRLLSQEVKELRQDLDLKNSEELFDVIVIISLSLVVIVIVLMYPLVCIRNLSLPQNI